jgi:hypothetical protein
LRTEHLNSRSLENGNWSDGLTESSFGQTNKSDFAVEESFPRAWAACLIAVAQAKGN